MRDGKKSGIEVAIKENKKKSVLVFEMSLNFLPIFGDVHWSLIVLINIGELPQKNKSCILHLDSIKGHHKASMIKSTLYKWLAAQFYADYQKNAPMDETTIPFLRVDGTCYITGEAYYTSKSC